MTRSATELVERLRQELEPGENVLVERISCGDAPLEALAALAAEELRIVASDWRTFLTLAAQANDPDARAFFTGLAAGEGLVLTLLHDFAAALREHYGFSDEACAFVDFFATPVPEMEAQALAAVQTGLDAGWKPDLAEGYGRLLQGFELMFWDTLAGS